MGVYFTMNNELQSFCVGKHKNSHEHVISLPLLYMLVPLTRRPNCGRHTFFLHLDECKSNKTSGGCWVCLGVEVAEMDVISFRAIRQSLCRFPSAGLFFWSLFSASISVMKHVGTQTHNVAFASTRCIGLHGSENIMADSWFTSPQSFRHDKNGCLSSGCCSVKYHRQRLTSKNNSFLMILEVRKGQGFLLGCRLTSHCVLL